MKKEKKFLKAVFLRNAFTLFTLISLGIYLHSLSIYLLIAGICLLITFIFQTKVKEQIDEETIALKKAQEQLRKRGEEQMNKLNEKINGKG